MDDEMMKALELDGEKLRQLTGEDHGPWFIAPMESVVCPDCDGTGVHVHATTVYEPGCAFPHSSTDETPCSTCNGVGHIWREVEPDETPTP